MELYSENRSINLIVKVAGNTCNLNCTYCFEQVKDVAHSYITPSMLKNTLDSINSTCSIVFHGGEPLIIGKEKFSELLDIVRKYFPQKVTAVRVQTNGTLIDEEWLDLFFIEYADLDIEIAISLDGTEYMNRLRVDYSGNSTFTSIRRAYSLLEKRGIQAGMLSVISKKSLPYFKEYIDFIASISNIRFVKINALFNIENGELSPDSITPQEYASFVINSGLYYIKIGLYKRIAIEPLLSILQKINHKESRYCNYSCKKCYNYISLYPDGSIGPCDCFSINDFFISNIDQAGPSGIESSIKIAANHSGCSLLQLVDECKNCDILAFCSGGCISQRYYLSTNAMLKKEYCESKHRLYDTFKKFSYVNGDF